MKGEWKNQPWGEQNSGNLGHLNSKTKELCFQRHAVVSVTVVFCCPSDQDRSFLEKLEEKESDWLGWGPMPTPCWGWRRNFLMSTENVVNEGRNGCSCKERSRDCQKEEWMLVTKPTNDCTVAILTTILWADRPLGNKGAKKNLELFP